LFFVVLCRVGRNKKRKRIEKKEGEIVTKKEAGRKDSKKKRETKE